MKKLLGLLIMAALVISPLSAEVKPAILADFIGAKGLSVGVVDDFYELFLHYSSGSERVRFKSTTGGENHNVWAILGSYRHPVMDDTHLLIGGEFGYMTSGHIGGARYNDGYGLSAIVGFSHQYTSNIAIRGIVPVYAYARANMTAGGTQTVTSWNEYATLGVVLTM